MRCSSQAELLDRPLVTSTPAPHLPSTPFFKSISLFCTWQSVILPPFYHEVAGMRRREVVRLCWTAVLLRTWALFWWPLRVPAWSLNLRCHHWARVKGYVSVCSCTFFRQLDLAMCGQCSWGEEGLRQEVTRIHNQLGVKFGSTQTMYLVLLYLGAALQSWSLKVTTFLICDYRKNLEPPETRLIKKKILRQTTGFFHLSIITKKYMYHFTLIESQEVPIVVFQS